MEKFNSMEYKVFNLIKNGKTRNEIIAEKVTTPANLSLILTGIYKKTAEFVNYHSERGKFEELAAYLRNNPDTFGTIPLSEFYEPEEPAKSAKKEKPKEETKQILKQTHKAEQSLRKNISKNALKNISAAADIEKIVLNALETVGNKIENDLQIMKAKAETLQDVYTEIYKGGVCLK